MLLLFTFIFVVGFLGGIFIGLHKKNKNNNQ